MGINGLEQTEDNPEVDSQDVQVLRDTTPKNGRSNSSKTKTHNFDGRRIFGGKAEGRRVLVVNLVHILVQRAPMEGAVKPVVPCILHDKEDCDLVGHLGPVRKRDTGVHAEVFAHWVEKPDLGKLDGEVAE